MSQSLLSAPSTLVTLSYDSRGSCHGHMLLSLFIRFVEFSTWVREAHTICTLQNVQKYLQCSDFEAHTAITISRGDCPHANPKNDRKQEMFFCVAVFKLLNRWIEEDSPEKIKQHLQPWESSLVFSTRYSMVVWKEWKARVFSKNIPSARRPN